MNAVPAIFSAVRLADGRWTLVGLNPERPYGPLWRRLPYSVERATTRIDPEPGRQGRREGRGRRLAAVE
jgi:hypothetical protein